MRGIPNASGPSLTLGLLGPSHQWYHKSQASLRGPPCAHGVAGTPQGEVRDNSPGTIPVNKTPIREKVKTMDVAYWTHNEQDKLQLLNLGTADDPKLVKLNVNLNSQLTTDATSLFKEYRDVFAFSYEV